MNQTIKQSYTELQTTVNLPNFLILGTQKAGTSALNHYLKEHPQIYMSGVKEPGFFDFEGRKVDFCGPGDRQAYRSAIADISAYQNLFQEVRDEIAIGEATTWYLQSETAPARIKHHLPDVRLIVILRNPVERAFSAYVHALRDNVEPIADFAQALAAESDRIKANWGYLWRYQQMGFYAQQLKRYYQYFDRDRLKIYLYEDFNRSPQVVLQDIYQFLSVDDCLIPQVFTRHNISGIAKNPSLDRFLYQRNNSVKNLLKPMIPLQLRRRMVNYLRVKNRVKPQLSPAIATQLKSVFREDIRELEVLIQRDLSSWLE